MACYSRFPAITATATNWLSVIKNRKKKKKKKKRKKKKKKEEKKKEGEDEEEGKYGRMLIDAQLLETFILCAKLVSFFFFLCVTKKNKIKITQAMKHKQEHRYSTSDI